jgi:glycosyltransferase involved in cell wall biosynthesis
MSDRSVHSVGVLPYGSKRWVGGLIYTHNLIRALRSLPDDERPDLRLLLTPKNSVRDHLDLKSCLPDISYYAFTRNWPLWKRAGGIGLSLTALRWPHSLEEAAASRRLGIVFPAHTSLGKSFPVPWIGWIPDFQHKRMPEFFSRAQRESRDRAFRRLAQDASHVVVSSQDAYGDLLRFFPTGGDRVSVLPFTMVADPEWYEGRPEQVAVDFGLSEKFLIFPSQFWVHKNHRLVFEALRIVRDRGLPSVSLVCTGYPKDERHPRHFDALKTWLEDQHLQSQVRILGFLPRRAQIQLMRRAAAVIQASLFEGWSALVEDARALGKRIYLSDIAVHREQEPPDAVYFNPNSAAELAELIARDWPDLSPGPDTVRENQARSIQEVRALDFARAFLRITARTVAQWSATIDDSKHRRS